MWLGWRGQPWALQDEWCVWLCPCSRGLMGQEELILGSGAGRRNAVPICKGPLAPHCKSEEHGWQPGVSQVWLSGTSRNGFESFPLCKVLVKLAWQMRREVGAACPLLHAPTPCSWTSLPCSGGGSWGDGKETRATVSPGGGSSAGLSHCVWEDGGADLLYWIARGIRAAGSP